MLALINTNAQADAPKTAPDRETHIIALKLGQFEDVLAEELRADRFGYQSDLECLLLLLCGTPNGVGPDGYVQQARAMQKREDQKAVCVRWSNPRWPLAVNGTRITCYVGSNLSPR
jgi:hypothetical protein